ncbi:MAG: hypothetical protein AAGA64_18630 [Bacteroidota bacterium]
MKKATFIILLIVTVISELKAQSFYNFRRGRDIIATFGTGTSSYFGDLNNPGDVIDTKLNLNFGLQYYFTERIAIRTEATYFRLSGDDAEADSEGRTVRNLSFRSDNFELNVVGIVQAFSNGTRFYQRPALNVYGFAGIGLLYFNPKAQVPDTDWNGAPLSDAGDYVALQPLQTEGVDYSRLAIVIPMGIGIKFKAGPFFNIGVEGGYRLTFTDYLDDVSTTYLLHSTLSGDPLRQALADRRHELDGNLPPLGVEEGQIRGNSGDNDGYFILNVKLEYYIPANILSSSKSKYNRRKRSRRARKR